MPPWTTGGATISALWRSKFAFHPTIYMHNPQHITNINKKSDIKSRMKKSNEKLVEFYLNRDQTLGSWVPCTPGTTHTYRSTGAPGSPGKAPPPGRSSPSSWTGKCTSRSSGSPSRSISSRTAPRSPRKLHTKTRHTQCAFRLKQSRRVGNNFVST